MTFISRWFGWLVSAVFWKWVFRLSLVGLVIGLIASIPLVMTLVRWSQDLPEIETLKLYEPPVTTRVHAGDGSLIAEFAREGRVFVPIEVVPERVKSAFISAEDKNFYTHGGVDYLGTLKAFIRTAQNKVAGDDQVFGGSSITQQVAKNFLTGDDFSLKRKWREALIARRIEQAFEKDEILELYINQIYLGKGHYGVGAASLGYFGKALDELTVAEAAYLAGVPKAPSTYDPVTRKDRAIARRNYVIDRMQANGYITAELADESRSAPLETVQRFTGAHYRAAGYFVEEVRRRLFDQFGEDQLYDGGLSVRTTIDMNMQLIAQRVLREGLEDYDRRNGYRGAIAQIDTSGDWEAALAQVELAPDLGDWRPAVVLSASDGFTVGLLDGELRGFNETGRMFAATAKAEAALRAGDVVYVGPDDDANQVDLKQVPAINGALVALDPHTGRVYAMAGGYSFRQSQFNRVTQARRQPGSVFKPFVYAAALESGYTPASLVLDHPFVALDPNTDLVYKPTNYTDRWYGPSTLRLGIEKSRNMMTVRLAQDIGMEKVVEYGKRFGIYDELQPYLPMSLGAGETTLLRLAAAYGALVNGGKRVDPVFVDRVQDRDGRTILTYDERPCEACDAAVYDGGEPPALADDRPQVVEPVTSYQSVSMLEGVIQRGTGTRAKQEDGRPLAGKSGTSNDFKDLWFVGFSPDLVVGVYVGFDQPRSTGDGEGGGRTAAPIFGAFMAEALKGKSAAPFRIPTGVRLVRIDARTGALPGPDTGLVIEEAFRPGTEPRRSYEGDSFKGTYAIPIGEDAAGDDFGAFLDEFLTDGAAGSDDELRTYSTPQEEAPEDDPWAGLPRDRDGDGVPDAQLGVPGEAAFEGAPADQILRGGVPADIVLGGTEEETAETGEIDFTDY